MKTPPFRYVTALLSLLAIGVQGATLYVDLNSPNPTPPYSDWSTASTNIQVAIEAANPGDTVLVTNGVYASGGKVMVSQTNRVALDKAITVQSVNGPFETVIQGAGIAGPIVSSSAVRCAWLTNNAALIGFTLSGGATGAGESNGGGVWCASSSAVVANCVITSNSAYNGAGGAYQGTLENCFIAQNLSSDSEYSGAGYATLLNCTVVSNQAYAVANCNMTNCIAFFNSDPVHGSISQSACQGQYCCTTPAMTGTSNFNANPQLAVDGMHLTQSSPCVGAGKNLGLATDLFGQSWSNPPSIGCAEWQPGPFVTQPSFQLTVAPFGFSVEASAIGVPPFSYFWLKDGVPTTDGSHLSGSQTANLTAIGVGPDDAGSYQLVASNSFGVYTSLVASVVLRFVNISNTTPLAPYTDWLTAATNIQDAVDAANPGDFILVTNGVYSAGGRPAPGSSLTNRVTLDRAVTLQSVNGPFVTTIQGPGLLSGPTAVRCAWLTNSAALIGFTLQGGGTLTSSSTDGNGGGVWCVPTNALVANCVIRSNFAYVGGAGAYQGTLKSCLITLNTNQTGSGAAASSFLYNCTVASNSAYGVINCSLLNSIVYFNGSSGSAQSAGYSCISPPGFTGTSNITANPQFLGDNLHFQATSPCIYSGINIGGGADIFGQPWANPPSMGCAEVSSMPYVTQPQIQLTGVPIGFTVGNVGLSGAGPFSFSWLKDGALLEDNGQFSSTQSSNLVVTGVSFSDAGAYQLVVSNTFGVVTSAVAQVVIHCVDAGGMNPEAPYTNWMTAAANIQDAITAAGAEDIILVTNGVYTNGGISMDRIITNRVSLNKILLVQSVNGPRATVIQGAWDPASTTGPAAMRCVWMTNNSILNGFTLYGGATATANFSSPNQSMSGGGIWASSNNAVVWNCIIATNYASFLGGGANSATLNNCTLIGNHAEGDFGIGGGAGAANCNVRNCLFTSNSADNSIGGGANQCNSTNSAFLNNSAYEYGSGINTGTAVNCTIVNNITSDENGSDSAAASGATLVNCIVYGNSGYPGASNNCYLCSVSYSDTDPLSAGAGNIDANPQLLADNIHLASGSPCIGAGNSNAVSGTDIDGQLWNNPPSIGCEEWHPAPMIAIQPTFQAGIPSRRSLGFDVVVAGQPPFNCYWSKDGILIQDPTHYSNFGATNLAVNGFEPEDAGAYQVVVSNSFGVVTSEVAQVVIRAVNVSSASPVAPYSTWETAATQIQDAIDAANPGDIVLVTNGLYNTGGRVMSGALTNRVALNKALTVISINGYANTMIQGQPDPVSTNGPGAVRCAWLTGGAVLNGFTLANGATGGSETTNFDSQCGGGAELAEFATVNNCVFTNNCAYYYGGGAAYVSSVSSGESFPGQVHNSFFVGNTALDGGGAYSAGLYNCTLIHNYCMNASGGTYGCSAFNCIVLYNYVSRFGILDYAEANYTVNIGLFRYSCTDPQVLNTLGNTNNIDASLSFLDTTFHLPAVSPIRGMGSSLYATGTDLDDQPWANPPSMGCSELVLSNLVGPLAVAIQQPVADALVNDTYGVLGAVTGRAESLSWAFGDGVIVTNAGYSIFHTWTNAGEYTVTLTAYNLDNPSGVSTNVTVVVDPIMSPLLGSAEINTNNSFQFSFLGQTNALYTVQYATNLMAPITWQTLETLFSTGQVMMVTDPPGTNAARFYRVQAR